VQLETIGTRFGWFIAAAVLGYSVFNRAISVQEALAPAESPQRPSSTIYYSGHWFLINWREETALLPAARCLQS
jgi:hypothetical protein